MTRFEFTIESHQQSSFFSRTSLGDENLCINYRDLMQYYQGKFAISSITHRIARVPCHELPTLMGPSMLDGVSEAWMVVTPDLYR